MKQILILDSGVVYRISSLLRLRQQTWKTCLHLVDVNNPLVDENKKEQADYFVAQENW